MSPSRKSTSNPRSRPRAAEEPLWGREAADTRGRRPERSRPALPPPQAPPRRHNNPGPVPAASPSRGRSLTCGAGPGPLLLPRCSRRRPKGSGTTARRGGRDHGKGREWEAVVVGKGGKGAREAPPPLSTPPRGCRPSAAPPPPARGSRRRRHGAAACRARCADRAGGAGGGERGGATAGSLRQVPGTGTLPLRCCHLPVPEGGLFPVPLSVPEWGVLSVPAPCGGALLEGRAWPPSRRHEVTGRRRRAAPPLTTPVYHRDGRRQQPISGGDGQRGAGSVRSPAQSRKEIWISERGESRGLNFNPSVFNLRCFRPGISL